VDWLAAVCLNHGMVELGGTVADQDCGTCGRLLSG